jgi:hypothetical protein
MLSCQKIRIRFVNSSENLPKFVHTYATLHKNCAFPISWRHDSTNHKNSGVSWLRLDSPPQMAPLSTSTHARTRAHTHTVRDVVQQPNLYNYRLRSTGFSYLRHLPYLGTTTTFVILDAANLLHLVRFFKWSSFLLRDICHNLLFPSSFWSSIWLLSF